jgi:hypothetical protein
VGPSSQFHERTFDVMCPYPGGEQAWIPGCCMDRFHEPRERDWLRCTAHYSDSLVSSRSISSRLRP